jgi:DNA-binding LacI/PurR family transcriptional regulator
LHGDTMPNMKQIAARAGVSLGTVSHVLNGTATVRDLLRKRVLKTIAAAGYQPNQLARGLRRVKTNMIGMIIPDVTNPFFPTVIRGAEDVAFANGYRLVLCNSDNDHSKELVHLRELRTYLPAGLIVIPSKLSDLSIHTEPYRKAGTALVCLDRSPRDWKGNTVTVANEEGAYGATRYLIQLGHIRVAMITGPMHLTNAQERLAGFKRAMREAKLNLLPGYLQQSTFDRQGGYAKACILLRMTMRPTAIFASNDMIAFGVIVAIRDTGLRCPEDVSVIGFDNLEMAEMIDPPLASVHQSGYLMGATAVRLILDHIARESNIPSHIELGTELKIRESVAPAREAEVSELHTKSRRNTGSAARRGGSDNITG